MNSEVTQAPEAATKPTAIERAVEKVGGQSSLARKLGLTPQAVQKWCACGSIPLDRVLDVEAATGVSRQDLCPEFFRADPPKTAAAA